MPYPLSNFLQDETLQLLVRVVFRYLRDIKSEQEEEFVKNLDRIFVR